jgi:hypothetical protein
MTVRLERYPATNAAVYFRADYQVGDKAGGATQTAVGTLEVHTKAAPGQDALKLETKTSFASLHEGESGHVVLTITNGTNDPLELSKVEASDLPYMEKVSSDQRPPTIAPQSAVSIDYRITAKKAINPGKYVGLIQAEARTTCGVLIYRVTSYEVTLGVFGQSELLTILGVPALLFLPGFLMLTLWVLLWSFIGLRVSFLAKGGTQEFFCAPKDAEFWMVGITLSLLMFAIAPRMTSLGYQRPYGLTDIAWLWAVSLGVSLVLYLMFFALDRWLARRRARITLTPIDDPISVVWKMKRRAWLKGNCRAVKFNSPPNATRGATEMHGFQLWAEKPGDSVWVIPGIKCWMTGKPSDLDPNKADNTNELLQMLQSIENEGATVAWAKDESGFNEPRLIKTTEVEGSEGDLVVMKWP